MAQDERYGSPKEHNPFADHIRREISGTKRGSATASTEARQQVRGFPYTSTADRPWISLNSESMRMGTSDKCQIGESNQSGGGKPLSIPLREYKIRPRKNEADGATRKQIQSVCGDTLPWVISFSLGLCGHGVSFDYIPINTHAARALVFPFGVCRSVFVVVGHNIFRILPNEVPILFILGWISLRLRNGGWKYAGLGRPKSWWKTVALASLPRQSCYWAANCLWNRLPTVFGQNQSMCPMSSNRGQRVGAKR